MNALGHGDERWYKALVEQAGKLAHTSNLYHTLPQVCGGVEGGGRGLFLRVSGGRGGSAWLRRRRWGGGGFTAAGGGPQEVGRLEAGRDWDRGGAETADTHTHTHH